MRDDAEPREDGDALTGQVVDESQPRGRLRHPGAAEQAFRATRKGVYGLRRVARRGNNAMIAGGIQRMQMRNTREDERKLQGQENNPDRDIFSEEKHTIR